MPDEIINFISERLTVKQKVFRLIANFPYLANDYNKLILWYWHYVDDSAKIFDNRGMVEFQKVHRLTPAESITRAFRELNSEGRIKIAVNMIDKRASQEVKFHNYYSAKRLDSL